MTLGQDGSARTFLDPRDKFWSLYLFGAERRDKTRAEHWKGTTDGILIFTGLFAATVASFIIYTLPMLSPDTGSQTVVLLSHVLLVLANNNTSAALPDGLPYALKDLDSGSAEPAAIIINIFLLMSLFLSLCCALASTLVQQWGRSYIHDSNRHASLGKRGLVHAGLERGIESSMDVTVALIVTVLHISVFLFFAGLIVLVFTTPHLYIKWAMTAAMALFGVTYILLSFVPFRHHDLPFCTPFSWFFSFLYMSCRQIHTLATSSIGDLLDHHGYGNASWLAILQFSMKSFWKFVFSTGTWSTNKRSACLDESLYRVPSQIRASWIESAFSRLDKSVDELGDAITLWESFIPFISTPHSGTDWELVRTLRNFAASDRYNLRLFWYRIKSMLLSLDSNKDGDVYFSRAVVACCTFTRCLLDIGLNEADMDGISSESQALIFRVFPHPVLDAHILSKARARSSGALIFLNAELRLSIHNVALRNNRWLEDVVYRGQYVNLQLHLDTRGRDTLESITVTAIHTQLVLNFIDLFRKILIWTETMGLTGVLATLQETSWLPLVTRVHAQALFSAQDEAVASTFIEQGHHMQARPRHNSTLLQLLSDLGIAEYKALEVVKNANGGTPDTFRAIAPEYRPLVQAYPELAHMVYSLCALLLDRRDVSSFSIRPSTRARTARSSVVTFEHRSPLEDAPVHSVRSSFDASAVLHQTARGSGSGSVVAGSADLTHIALNMTDEYDSWVRDDTFVDEHGDGAPSTEMRYQGLLRKGRVHSTRKPQPDLKTRTGSGDVVAPRTKSIGSEIILYKGSIAETHTVEGKRSLSLSTESARAMSMVLVDMHATRVREGPSARSGDGPTADHNQKTDADLHADLQPRETEALLDAWINMEDNV